MKLGFLRLFFASDSSQAANSYLCDSDANSYDAGKRICFVKLSISALKKDPRMCCKTAQLLEKRNKILKSS